MKVRYLGTLLLAVLTFFGCDDNTGTLGLGMLPDSDGMSAHTTTFNVTTRSFAVDSVFAKTSTGYIGKFSDPEFGYYETSFLTELNCTENFSLPEVYKVTERDSEGNPIKATGTMTADSVVSNNHYCPFQISQNPEQTYRKLNKPYVRKMTDNKKENHLR